MTLAKQQWWADYSAGTVPAAVLKKHGYVGVIRYVTAPDLMNPRGMLQKHTTRAEFNEHQRAGLQQLLVYQGDTTDADGGYNLGRRNAQRALAGCEYLGYSGLVFFTNDRPSLPNPHAWREYLDGAASILGESRVGAYGFGNAMDAARGHAVAFWQAGRRSDVRAHTNFWQDNNHQPVIHAGGRAITTDRNLVLKPIEGVADMPLTKDDLRQVHDAVWHGVAGAKLIRVRGPQPDGWAEYALGALPQWVIDWHLKPMRQQLNQVAQLLAKQSGVTAEQLADALRAGLVADVLPVLQDVVRDALGEDNQDQADEIATRVLDGLATRLEAGGDEQPADTK